MFLIANAGRSEVALSDLGIVIKPNQAIDLHNVKTSINPEKSKDLSLAMKTGVVKILKRDILKKNRQQVNQNITVNEGINKEELLNDLKTFIKEELSEKQQSQPIQSESLGVDEIRELIKILKSQQKQQVSMEQLQQLLSSGTVQMDSNTSVDNSEDIDDIDENKIIEMHSKAINKIAKNLSGEVGYSHQKVKDDSLSNNVDELENLL